MPDNPRLGRQDLFPPIEPYQSGALALDRLHTMYWEQSGNQAGVPAVFLHGGPGAGATPTHRRFFDPNFYRIVVFDQRGVRPLDAAGRDHRQPTWSTSSPTSRRLQQSISASSAGWCSAAPGVRPWRSPMPRRFPERCLGLVLRGIFLCRQSEIDWFLYGMRAVFPEAWRAFAALRARGRAGRSALGLFAAAGKIPTPHCICRRRAPGAPMRARARPCCRARTRSRPSARTAWPWAWRGSRRIISAAT